MIYYFKINHIISLYETIIIFFYNFYDFRNILLLKIS